MLEKLLLQKLRISSQFNRFKQVAYISLYIQFLKVVLIFMVLKINNLYASTNSRQSEAWLKCEAKLCTHKIILLIYLPTTIFQNEKKKHTLVLLQK